MKQLIKVKCKSKVLLTFNKIKGNSDDKCPVCGSSNYVSVPRGEECDDCGYHVYYP